MYSFISSVSPSYNNDWTQNKFQIANPVIDPLPQGAQGYSTNNQFDKFPPLMNDGRAITSAWQSMRDLNATMHRESGIQTNFDYRKYMINNAEKLIKQNMEQVLNDSGYYTSMARANESNYKYLDPHRIKQATPYMADREVPAINESDLRREYLSREELEMRRRPVVLTQEDMLKLRKQY
jgi:hypothetical protein